MVHATAASLTCRRDYPGSMEHVSKVFDGFPSRVRPAVKSVFYDDRVGAGYIVTLSKRATPMHANAICNSIIGRFGGFNYLTVVTEDGTELYDEHGVWPLEEYLLAAEFEVELSAADGRESQ